MVDRVCSTSFIAGLDERGRGEVLGRVRELAAGWTGPLRLGYTTEAYVYERASSGGRRRPGAGPPPTAANHPHGAPRTRSRTPGRSPS